nr:MAG TPA: hypothetical protein [Caudoviricetes sp.]
MVILRICPKLILFHCILFYYICKINDKGSIVLLIYVSNHLCK